MSVAIPDLTLPLRSKSWKWWICALLLLATMVNYMDRLTLNLMSRTIMETFRLNERDYGMLESAFGTAFAFGAIVMGWVVDRWNVRWIYPAAVLAWSLAGFATGLAQGFAGLLICRFLLGLAEAGNWPCALRTTQRILSAEERTLGNGILQSGAAFGAVLTPLLLLGLSWTGSWHVPFLSWTGSWRVPFMAIGALGVFWAVLWLVSVRSDDLHLEHQPSPSLFGVLFWLVLLFGVDVWVHMAYAASLDGQMAPADRSLVPLLVKVTTTVLGISVVFFWLWHVTRHDTALPRSVFFRRYWVLAVLVVMINGTWHYFRAWLPLFLMKHHGYDERQTSWFSVFYYIASDAGSLSAGFAVLYLARNWLSVHWSRVVVAAVCAALTMLSAVAAFLPAGLPLLGVLLLIGFATLALFPSYYSFSQELTVQHQGKLTGSLGCTCWLSMSLLHELAGDAIVRTGSYTHGVALAGFAPLVGLLGVVFFWGQTPAKQTAAEVLPVVEEDKFSLPATPAIRAAVSDLRE